jgi:arylsulfatase A-like enzyme
MRPSEHHQPDREQVDAVTTALLQPEVAPFVDMTIAADADGYEVVGPDGRIRFHREAEGHGWRYEVDEVVGRNPIENQDPAHLSPLADERANPFPREQNAYPFAYEQVGQLFDHPAAPDVCVIHSSAHNWEDQGGHRGEHGSIGVVQARAPFIVSGAGVQRRGIVPEACRLIDVAPTVAALLGVAPVEGVGQNGTVRAGALLRRQDGDVQSQVLTGEPARHVVGFLFDGTNANVLHELVAQGDAPNVARLIEQGTSFGHGAMSSLPTVTLANHTSILTGAMPGHHGILNNAWYDRARGEQVITNSPETWAWAMGTLSDEVETLFEAVSRTWPDDVTFCINEPADRGAWFSTLGLMRAGGLPDRPPGPDELPFATERFVRPVKDYRSASRMDHTSLDQAVKLFAGRYQELEAPLPRFAWVNFSLTDAAFHEGGPYSEMARASVRDTDARMGEVLRAVEEAGIWDQTAFFLVADHGMEESNPEVQGDWAPALSSTGIPLRDEAYGFVYLDV